MAFSVNTNAGALAALSNLNRTQQLLNTTQQRINTGLEVASARDDAATFSIAQTLRGDLAGFRAVNGSLDRAASELDVAIAGAEAISDLLIELRELAVAGSDSGLDANSRQALNDQFTNIRDQINSITSNATFNGRNLLDGTSGVSAITDSTGSATITTSASDLSLTGLSLDGSNLITTTGAAISGTVVALAGQSISAGSDSDFRAALVNLQNDNGGTLNGETIDASTGVTTDNVGSPPVSDEFNQGVQSALGISGQFDLSSVDGFAFSVDFNSGSTVFLVRDGANSFLSNGDPSATGSAATPDASRAAVTAIDAAIDTVNSQLSTLGSTANRVELQQNFASRLSDSIRVGIGNLVDADLAEEAANLQSAQVRQQLGLQALSIANQAPQSVLSLFR